MPNKIIFSAGLAAVVAFSFGSQAKADFVMTIKQVGPNVVGTGSGSIDLTDATGSFDSFTGTFVVGPAIGLGGVPPSTQPVEGYGFILTGSTTDFGIGGETDGSSGGGNDVAIAPSFGYAGGTGDIYVPHGYVSHAPLSDFGEWDDTTIAALGLIPGTYTYDYGRGDHRDSFVLDIQAPATAPEPASLTLLATGAVRLFLRRRNQRINKRTRIPAKAGRSVSSLSRLLRRSGSISQEP